METIQCPTLLQLKQRVEDLINTQGEEAPVAWWIFTNEDVFTTNDNNEPQYKTIEVCQKVLNGLQEYDHIYTEIFDAITNELKEDE